MMKLLTRFMCAGIATVSAAALPQVVLRDTTALADQRLSMMRGSSDGKVYINARADFPLFPEEYDEKGQIEHPPQIHIRQDDEDDEIIVLTPRPLKRRPAFGPSPSSSAVMIQAVIQLFGELKRSCPTNEFPKPPRAFELVDHLEDITQSLSEATEVLIQSQSGPLQSPHELESILPAAEELVKTALKAFSICVTSNSFFTVSADHRSKTLRVVLQLQRSANDFFETLGLFAAASQADRAADLQLLFDEHLQEVMNEFSNS